MTPKQAFPHAVQQAVQQALPPAPPARRMVEIEVAKEHPAFNGHFDAAPVLPGVMLLAWVIEAAMDDPYFSSRLGPNPQVDSVKFLWPVRPGAGLHIELGPGKRGVDFCVWCADTQVAKGQLSPMPSASASPA